MQLNRGSASVSTCSTGSFIILSLIRGPPIRSGYLGNLEEMALLDMLKSFEINELLLFTSTPWYLPINNYFNEALLVTLEHS